MNYTPNVNDYVEWKPHIEGWVYFKCSDYITIETYVQPKDPLNYKYSRIHANNRLLVICYSNQWKDLKYIKSRKTIHEEF